MKFYTHQTPIDARSRGQALPPLAPGVSWARFGEETLLYADEDTTMATAAAAAPSSRGARLPQRQADVSREQLYVVVQSGRLFQQHHPRVPVIHDRGRFLLVKLSPKRARELQGDNETCYGILPLTENQVIFDVSERGVAARAPVAFVQNLVNKVNRASFEASLTKLVSFQTRNSTSEEYVQSADFARQQLKTLGFQTRQQQIAVNGATSRNIIADKTGKGSQGERQVVVVTAHLDSINLRGGPTAPAPGADDNGSGSAGILEIARVFQSHQSANDLRLILFGGEEQGLFGSKRYVASLTAAEKARIRAVVNMDMIANLNGTTPSVLLEGSEISQSIIDGLASSAATYTQLTIETSLIPFNSDHVSFINKGIPAVLTIEGADNTNNNVHSARDTLDKVSFDLALEILRMNVAFIASEIGDFS